MKPIEKCLHALALLFALGGISLAGCNRTKPGEKTYPCEEVKLQPNPAYGGARIHRCKIDGATCFLVDDNHSLACIPEEK